MEVIHSAIWVSDLERSLAFYEDAVGLDRTRTFEGGDGATNVFLAGPNGVELQLKHTPDRGPVEPAGIDHIALRVDDTDAALDRLQAETGCPLRRGPLDSAGANARVAFIEDPDGYGVELVEPFDGN